jgi:hypothetical protein
LRRLPSELDGILHIGCLLIPAKETLRLGEFQKMLEGDLPLDASKALAVAVSSARRDATKSGPRSCARTLNLARFGVSSLHITLNERTILFEVSVTFRGRAEIERSAILFGMPAKFSAILLRCDVVDASLPREGVLLVVYFKRVRPSMVLADIGCKCAHEPN